MGINEGVDDAHHDNSILKASKKVEKMAPPLQNCNVPPNRGEKVVQERGFVVV